VVDILMIVRAGVNKNELAERVQRAGAETPVRTGLRLAQALFGNEACGDLLENVHPRSGDAMAAWLVNGRTVVLAQSNLRSRYSWRRQFYRWMLRQSPLSAA
jgi:hypothetical protein